MDVGRLPFRLARVTAFALVCVAASLGLHVLAGGEPIAGPVLGVAILVTGTGAFFLAGRQRGLPVILAASFAAQYGLHHGFTATAGAAPAEHHGGSPTTMFYVHVAMAVVTAWWLERGESGLATLLALLVARVTWWLRLPAAARPIRAIRPHAHRSAGFTPTLRLLAPVLSRRGPPR